MNWPLILIVLWALPFVAVVALVVYAHVVDRRYENRVRASRAAHYERVGRIIKDARDGRR